MRGALSGSTLVVVAMCAQLAGCGATLETSAIETVSMPSLAELPVIVVNNRHFPTSAIETYTLVARGAKRCWFGAQGPLKDSHIFHAEVTPPAKGGRAEIDLHEREGGEEAVRGSRAYTVSIVPDATGSVLDQKNLRFTKEQGAVMARDVVRWAKGETECEASVGEPPSAAAPDARLLATGAEASR